MTTDYKRSSEIVNKSVVTAVILIVICITLIILIPATTVLFGFSSYDKINENLTFYYAPQVSSQVEELNLVTSIGNLEVHYTSMPIDYAVKVEVFLKISGSYLAGKSYLDFLDIEWQNTTSPISFSLAPKSYPIIDQLYYSIEEVLIIATLRADIVFDINTTVSEGNTEISVPFAVIVNDVSVNSHEGNTTLDFTQCVIGGDINVMNSDGNILLTSYDLEYIRESTWILTTETGNINAEIIQYKAIGADVFGSAISAFGHIELIYRDYNPNIGAKIEAEGYFAYAWYESYNITTFKGFENIFNTQKYISHDFPAKNNFDIWIEALNGSLHLDLSSE
jgi:hypothetical protein